jgi:hypothetical protein
MWQQTVEVRPEVGKILACFDLGAARYINWRDWAYQRRIGGDHAKWRRLCLEGPKQGLLLSSTHA